MVEKDTRVKELLEIVFFDFDAEQLDETYKELCQKNKEEQERFFRRIEARLECYLDKEEERIGKSKPLCKKRLKALWTIPELKKLLEPIELQN